MKRFLITILVVIFLTLLLGAGYVLRYPCDQKPYPGILAFALQYRCGTVPEAPAATGTLPAPTAGTGASGASSPVPANTQGALPPTLAAVFQNPVAGFFPNADGSVNVIEENGKIAVSNAGGITPLSESQIPNLIRASFSPDGKKILAVFGAQTNPAASIFAVDDKTWHPLPQGIQSPAWAATSSKIAYLSPATGGAWNLTTLDAGNPKAKPQTILQLHVEDMDLAWPGADRIIVFGKSNVRVPASLINVSIKNKTVTPILDNMPGLSFLWGEKAGRVVVFKSNASERGGTLDLRDTNGNILFGLNIGTLPSKCLFDDAVVGQASSTPSTQQPGRLICAVPQDQEKFSRTRLPDDYLMQSFFTADSFYAIDLSDGAVESLNNPVVAVDATMLRRSGAKLYFINRLDKKLYALTLPE